MANAHRGEVALGDYTVSFSVNALADLEGELDMPVAKIAETMNKPENVRIGTVRALLWAGLQDNHDVDLKAAGRIATEVGIPAAMEAIGKAFSLAFPDAEGEKSARPPKAKAAN